MDILNNFNFDSLQIFLSCLIQIFEGGLKTCTVYSPVPTKPYKFEHCGKSFARPDKLKFYVQTHTGKRPYKCENCGQCFWILFDFKSHMHLHMSEKPYECQNYDKLFSTKVIDTWQHTHKREILHM